MKLHFSAMAAIAIALSSTTVYADGVIDGSIGAAYGSAVEVQSVQTQFGDADGTAAGSELDAGYAFASGGRLYMGISGNLEESFNKMHLFFDTQSGVGENVLSATPAYDFANLSTNLGGMTFDTGFTAQYHMFVRSGGGGNFEVDFIDRLGGTSADVNGNFGNVADNGGEVATGNLATGAVGSALSESIFFVFDNSNILGVGGGTAAADQVAAAAVTTGFEFSIALADLGLDPNVANTIRVAAAIGNGDNNFFSNQFLGGLPGDTGNLGGDNAGGFTGDSAGVDLTAFAGDQFMTINIAAVPEPSAMILIGLGGLFMAQRRKR